MGSYSSDSDSDRKSKHRKRRRKSSKSRSRSRSLSVSSSHSSSKRKHKHSRSKSRSPDRSRRSQKAKSSSKKSRRSYSRSRSRSRSKSKSDFRSSHHSKSSRRRSRSRNRKSSSDKRRGSKDSKSYSKGHSDDSDWKKSDSESSSSFNVQPKNQDELLKKKLQMALKAAADADAQLREQGVLVGGRRQDWPQKDEDKDKFKTEPLSFSDQTNRANAIQAISAPGFVPQTFQSRSSSKKSEEGNDAQLSGHDAAIFGTNSGISMPRLSTPPPSIPLITPVIKDAVAHENLFVDPEVKKEKWIRKLIFMRQRKLNGEAMYL